MKSLLFSLSKDKGDFVVTPFKGSGNGGQKRNKTMSACRISHPASGAVSECQEERSFQQNKKRAFARLLQKEEFVRWHRTKVAKALGREANVDAEVTEWLKERHLRIEAWDGKNWVVSSINKEDDNAY